MRISTKKGDRGFSSLVDGRKLKKSSEIFEILGGLDELDSFIGLGRAIAMKEKNGKKIWELLKNIQLDIYIMKSVIAGYKKIKPISGKNVKFLESHIESWEKKFRLPSMFVMPGADDFSARIHVARTVCRRVERMVVKNKTKLKIPDDILIYLNRLSDLLFLLSF